MATKPSSRELRILIADDHQEVLRALALLFKREGMTTVAASSPAEVLRLIEQQSPDLALIDLNYTRDTTSGQEGLDLLARIRSREPDLPVVVMTAWAQIKLAVEATRRGAADFIEKPWNNEQLLQTIRTRLALAETVNQNRKLSAANRLLRENDEQWPLTNDPVFQDLLTTLKKVAPTDASVLITGENGTGKGVVARWLHNQSARGDLPLVSVNMGAIPENLFESEMFGHTKGAFTGALESRVGRFEIAEGGTLFLDEIACVPLNQQPKLLRVLETGEFEPVGSSRTRRGNVRTISATNADCDELVRQGKFRQDLLFRLNTISVRIPPLRERGDDVMLLAEHFLKELCARYQRAFRGVAANAEKQLRHYQWPGNVRELRHVLERAVLTGAGPLVSADDLAINSKDEGAGLDGMTLAQAETYLIHQALQKHRGNAARAASVLGLSKSAMYRRLEKLGIRES